MSEYTHIAVEILNRQYQFQAQAEDMEVLNKAVTELQSRIRAIVEENTIGGINNESIVVSAALNIAKDYLESGAGKDRIDGSSQDVSKLLDELEGWLEEKDNVSTILMRLRKSDRGQ